MQKKFWSQEFTALIGSTFFTAWAFYALLPTLPMYLLETLKMNHTNVGLVIAAFSVSVILVRPVAGYLVDNYDRSAALIISVSLITLGYALYPLVSSVWGMLLIRFVHGAMFGMSTSASATIVADIVPSSRIGQGIGIYALSVPIGMTIGPAFGLALLNSQGPNGMFLSIFCVSCLSLFGAIYAKTPSKPLTKRRLSPANLFHKNALPISLCTFFVMIVYGAIIVFVGIHASQKHFPNVGTFFICFSATIFLSRLFAGRLFDKGHIFPLISVGLMLTAVGVAWLGYAGTPIQFLVAGMFNGLGFGVLMPTGQAAINSLVKPSERGAANSTYLFSYDLGIGVGSLIIGFLLDTVSLGEIYRYSVFLIILSAGIFVLKAMPHYRRHREDSEVIP